jgi:hypothetical protein
MNTDKNVTVDERTLAVACQGALLAHSFVAVALFIDLFYRRLVFHETAWDLCAIVFGGMAISRVYIIRHKAQEVGGAFGRKMMIINAYGLIVIAVSAFILAIMPKSW